MQLITLLIAALAATVTAQTYEIKLYSHRDCLITAGKKCSGLTERECCSDGDKYKSGKFSESGSSSSSNQLKLYNDPCDGIAVEQHTGTSCLSHDDKTIEGAAVFTVISLRDESSLLPMRVVEPDEAFLEEGNYVYTIKRNSTMGEAYDRLTNIEDQVAHLRTFGKRDLIQS